MCTRWLEVVALGGSPAPIAQGIERLPPEQKAAGSNPAGGTLTFRTLSPQLSLVPLRLALDAVRALVTE